MTSVELIRVEESKAGTFGAVKINGQTFCCSLEPPDRNNAANVSNIPPGTYRCLRFLSPTFGETFEVTGIQDRTRVLFHAGNTVEHTHGCILLGEYWGKLRDQRAVLNSGATFKAFLRAMDGQNEFMLHIRELPPVT